MYPQSMFFCFFFFIKSKKIGIPLHARVLLNKTGIQWDINTFHGHVFL